MIPFGGETVTLYNRRTGRDQNGRTLISWRRAELTSCSWTRRTVRTVVEGHVRIGETIVCRIPASPDYARPDEWDALDNAAGRFTLSPGDVIVRGCVPDEVGGQITETALSAKYARRGVMTVTSARDNSAAPLGHYAAEGV